MGTQELATLYLPLDMYHHASRVRVIKRIVETVPPVGIQKSTGLWDSALSIAHFLVTSVRTAVDV